MMLSKKSVSVNEGFIAHAIRNTLLPILDTLSVSETSYIIIVLNGF